MPNESGPLLRAWLAVWRGPGRVWAAMMKAGSLTVWQRFGGALVVSSMVLLVIMILWKGPWSPAAEAMRLEWLGRYGVLLIFALVICVVALFEFRLNFTASKSGISANMDGDDEERHRTTTGSVSEAPAAPPPPVDPAEADMLPAGERVNP